MLGYVLWCLYQQSTPSHASLTRLTCASKVHVDDTTGLCALLASTVHDNVQRSSVHCDDERCTLPADAEGQLNQRRHSGLVRGPLQQADPARADPLDVLGEYVAMGRCHQPWWVDIQAWVVATWKGASRDMRREAAGGRGGASMSERRSHHHCRGVHELLTNSWPAWPYPKYCGTVSLHRVCCGVVV